MRNAVLFAIAAFAACAPGSSTTPPTQSTAVTPSPTDETDAEDDAPVASAPAIGTSAESPPTVLEPKAAYQPIAIEVEVRGTGRPIIFIPGLGCSPSIYDPVVAHLATIPGGVEAHLVSFAGYAGKPAIDKPLLPTAREDLVAYIKDRNLDHPIVIGHSLGGFMALWLAQTEPDLVGGVVNVDAAPNFYADAAPINLREKADRWRALSKGEFKDTLRNYYNPMSSDRKRLDAAVNDVVKSDQKAYVESFMEMSKVNIVPKIASIKAPVISILSDSQYFFEFVQQQMATVPDSKIVMLKNTRHFVFFDDPAGFYRSLDGFLAAHPPR